jgi:hypothetical protein
MPYLFSLVRWQMISTEKLKARANAIACQIDSTLKKEMSIMMKQKRLTMTVSAFFSEKYFLIAGLFTRII